MDTLPPPVIERPKLSPASVLIHDAFELYRKRFSLLLAITVIPTVVSSLFSLLNGRYAELQYTLTPEQGALFLGVVIIMAVTQVWGQVALVLGITEPDDTSPTLHDIAKRAATKIIPFLWVSIINIVAAFGGGILLVIPAVILSLWASMAVYTVVLEGKRGLDALAASKEYIRGLWWQVLGRYVVLALLSMGILIPVGMVSGMVAQTHTSPTFAILIQTIIALLWTPFTVAYMFRVYTDLKGLNPTPDPKKFAQSKNVFRAFAAFAVIVVLIGGVALFSIIKKNFPLFNETCGGIAGKTCPEGYWCDSGTQQGNDISGICRKGTSPGQ